jgi:L,D-peptidoglycan transpeptidase YkuD (ErfK/YbiS/YcfS/YnhG family)
VYIGSLWFEAGCGTRLGVPDSTRERKFVFGLLWCGGSNARGFNTLQSTTHRQSEDESLQSLGRLARSAMSGGWGG